MKTMASLASRGQLEFGSVVSYPLPDVDRTKVDPANLTFVVVCVKGSADGPIAPMYKLGNNSGILKGYVCQSYLTLLPIQSPKLMGLAHVLEQWRGMTQIESVAHARTLNLLSAREIAAKESLVGGAG